MTVSQELAPGLIPMPEGVGEHAQDAVLPMAPLMRAWFGALHTAGVRYAVLRNGERLPEYTNHDVDVLFHPRDLDVAVTWLEADAARLGWRIVGRMRKRGYLGLLLYGPVGQGQFLPVDCFSALEQRGWVYADVDVVLASRVQTPAGVWVLEARITGELTLLKELLAGSVISRRKRERIRACLAEGGGQSVLSALLGDEAVAACRMIAEGDWPDEAALRASVCREIRRSRHFYLLERLASAWRALSQCFDPSISFHLVIAGPDGCGKTTLARCVAERLYKRPFRACRYLKGRFGVLPQIRSVRERVRAGGRRAHALRSSGEAPPETSDYSGMMTPLAPWKSMLLSGYYALDACLGRLLLRRWRAQWLFVVSDRSFFDYYYQLGHAHVPTWWLHMLGVLVPTPDLLVTIHRDAARIHAGKPELTVTEIEREQRCIAEEMARYANTLTLDGDAGVEECVEQLVGQIVQRCARGRGSA